MNTGCSKKTVTSNFSLTDLKITKNGVTQSFLESLYPTIYASSTCLMFKWPVWATLDHFLTALDTFGHIGTTFEDFGKTGVRVMSASSLVLSSLLSLLSTVHLPTRES